MIHADVLVVGAGPAGLAAATVAAEQGQQVILLDDNMTPGGQIWRGETVAAQVPPHGHEERTRQDALHRLARSGAVIMSGYRVFDALSSSALHAIREDAAGNSVEDFCYKNLIVATGARERLLPFPGWTLPGVCGAGGLQALVKGGFPVRGRRIVVAGTGPLLLAVAAHLKGDGATIVSIAEQTSLARLAPFALSLVSHSSKLVQGARYRRSLAKAPFRTGCWPVEAIANEDRTALRAVRLTDGRRTWEEPCDLLACGFHLVPNTELLSLLGCEFNNGFVSVDAQHRTSVRNVYCVGEPTGIAGLDAARIQGEIAGLAVVCKVSTSLVKRARKERVFASRMEEAFALRPELRSLSDPQTIVCRCEDVPLSMLLKHSGWTDAKLQTRCGMGPCQGRICGPAVEFLFGWKSASVRPPIFPVPVGALNLHETLFKEKQ